MQQKKASVRKLAGFGDSDNQALCPREEKWYVVSNFSGD